MSAGGLVTRPWRLLPLPWSILLGYQGSEEQYFYLQCQDLNKSAYIYRFLQNFNQQYQTQTLEFCPYKEYLGKVEFRVLADSWTILPYKTLLTIDKYLWDLTSLLRLGVCGKFAPPKLTRSVSQLTKSRKRPAGKIWQGQEEKWLVKPLLHNCRKTHKVNTIPRSLMEHPVFIMYKVQIHLKKKKSRRKKVWFFFLTLLGFVPTISKLQAV